MFHFLTCCSTKKTTPGFIYSILSNRTLVVVEECLESDDGCSDERSVLELKSWLRKGTRINNMLATIKSNVDNNTTILTEVYFSTINDRSSTDELIDGSMILMMRFDETHYNETNWKDYATQSHSSEHVETQLEKLYSNGVDFLYGLLFHEIFSIHEGFEPSWEDSMMMNPTTIVLELAEHQSYNVPSIQNCVNSIIVSDYASTGSDIMSPDCHVFVLSNDRHLNESKFGRYIESQRLEDDDNGVSWHMTEHDCSITHVPFPSTPFNSIATTNEIGSWWRNADLVSHARSGWIGPSNNDPTPQEGTAQHAAAQFIKERIEYRRYVETWKMGRDPFMISELEVCNY